jgi:hypothetical protein
MAEFQVDPAAAKEMKESGDYGTGEPKEGEEKPELSEEDPGESLDDDGEPLLEDKGDELDDDDADDDEEGEGADDDDDDKAGPEFSVTQTKWMTEFTETGDLSPETRAEAAKVMFHPDLPKEVVDEYTNIYVAGMQALGTAANASAYAVVGGPDEYVAMTTWAKANLSEAEIEAFDADALGTDIVRRDSAILGLNARMQQDVGAEPNLEPDLTHDGGRGRGEPIIGSLQELSRIQGTDRYKKDAAYRDLVERQVRQSMKTGLYRTS